MCVYASLGSVRDFTVYVNDGATSCCSQDLTNIIDTANGICTISEANEKLDDDEGFNADSGQHASNLSRDSNQNSSNLMSYGGLSSGLGSGSSFTAASNLHVDSINEDQSPTPVVVATNATGSTSSKQHADNWVEKARKAAPSSMADTWVTAVAAEPTPDARKAKYKQLKKTFLDEMQARASVVEKASFRHVNAVQETELKELLMTHHTAISNLLTEFAHKMCTVLADTLIYAHKLFPPYRNTPRGRKLDQDNPAIEVEVIERYLQVHERQFRPNIAKDIAPKMNKTLESQVKAWEYQLCIGLREMWDGVEVMFHRATTVEDQRKLCDMYDDIFVEAFSGLACCLEADDVMGSRDEFTGLGVAIQNSFHLRYEDQLCPTISEFSKHRDEIKAATATGITNLAQLLQGLVKDDMVHFAKLPSGDQIVWEVVHCVMWGLASEGLHSAESVWENMSPMAVLDSMYEIENLIREHAIRLVDSLLKDEDIIWQETKNKKVNIADPVTKENNDEIVDTSGIGIEMDYIKKKGDAQADPIVEEQSARMHKTLEDFEARCKARSQAAVKFQKHVIEVARPKFERGVAELKTLQFRPKKQIIVTLVATLMQCALLAIVKQPNTLEEARKAAKEKGLKEVKIFKEQICEDCWEPLSRCTCESEDDEDERMMKESSDSHRSDNEEAASMHYSSNLHLDEVRPEPI